MALFSNATSVIRQYLSDRVGDLIMGTPDSGSSTTLVDTELANPGWSDDYFNEDKYKCYIYAGTNIEEERFVTDWVQSTHTLTLAPAFTAAIDATSLYELHYLFSANEYLRAINLGIEAMVNKHLVYIKDETTIRLTSTEDIKGDTVYTFEYALPTSMLYLYQVITEEALGGTKLTGTVSGAFTAGETVTGGTSGFTGELSYGVAGGTYIRVRKVSGTPVVGETATGGTSNETCSSITAVDSETAGGGRWLNRDIIDPRYYSIIKSYPPKLKLDKRYYSINEDLYLRLEGQGAQPKVDDDTDVIYLPPDWLIAEAILNLPHSKILSGKLINVWKQAREDVDFYRRNAGNFPHPRARSVVE